jgi:hypothetical protein
MMILPGPAIADLALAVACTYRRAPANSSVGGDTVRKMDDGRQRVTGGQW